MKHKKSQLQVLLTISICCILPSMLFGIDWPIQDGKGIKNFGFNEKGQAERGILFLSENLVFPADAGELIFISSNNRRGPFLQPLGNWVALQHQDSLIGIYGHLSEIEANSISSIAERSNPIAKAGNSGWSNSSQLQFSVFDRKTSGYVNPQLLINMTDTKAPLIKQTILVGQDGQKIMLGQIKKIKQGSYRFYIEAYDEAEFFANNVAAPYQFRVFLNGALQGNLELDLLSAKNGNLQVGLRKGQDTNLIYQTDGTYFMGEITMNRGKILCEVIVADTMGNMRSQTYQFQVE